MRLASMILLATISLGAAPGAAFDLPPRKPGLWELSQTTNIGPNNSRTEVVQHCVDTDTDALLRRLEMTRLQQAKCTRMDLRREDGAVVLDAECKAGETDIATRAVTRGDFDTQYTGTLHIRRLIHTGMAHDSTRDDDRDRGETDRPVHGRHAARRCGDAERPDDQHL